MQLTKKALFNQVLSSAFLSILNSDVLMAELGRIIL